MELRREKAVDAADDQAIFGMVFTEDGEGAQQAVEVFMRMEGRDGEQETLGSTARGEIEEAGSTPEGMVRSFDAGQAVPAHEIVGASRRRSATTMRGDYGAPEEEEIPEREVEPAEVFGVALVLQVVKDGDLAAAADERRGEAGIEEDVEAAGARRPAAGRSVPRAGARAG